MAMRITQSMMTRNYLSNLNTAMSNLSRSKQRIATGRNYEHLSENVSAGIKSIKVREQITTNDTYVDSIENVKNELSSAESSLMSIVDILSTVNEKVTKAQNSATMSADDRNVIANEIESLRDQILKTANSQFNDKYMFGGTNTGSSPFKFDSTTGELTYNGADVDKIEFVGGEYILPGPNYPGNATDFKVVDQNEKRYIDIGLGISFDAAGKVDPNTAFEASFSGIGAFGFGKDAEGNPKNIIKLLTDVANAVAPENRGGGTYNGDKLGKLSGKLKIQTDNVTLNITEIGTRTQFLENTVSRLEDDTLNLKALHKRLYEVDEATEITNEKMYEFSWNAILQVGSQIIPPSLMDFIR